MIEKLSARTLSLLCLSLTVALVGYDVGSIIYGFTKDAFWIFPWVMAGATVLFNWWDRQDHLVVTPAEQKVAAYERRHRR